MTKTNFFVTLGAAVLSGVLLLAAALSVLYAKSKKAAKSFRKYIYNRIQDLADNIYN